MILMSFMDQINENDMTSSQALLKESRVFRQKVFIILLFSILSKTTSSNIQLLFTFFLPSAKGASFLSEAGMLHGIMGLETKAFVHRSQPSSVAMTGQLF